MKGVRVEKSTAIGFLRTGSGTLACLDAMRVSSMNAESVSCLLMDLPSTLGDYLMLFKQASNCLRYSPRALIPPTA